MAESSGERMQNDFKAGIFIFLTIGLAIAVLIILSGWSPFSAKTPYKVRFSVDSGINGLAEGSNVKVGGLNRGSVTEVLPQFITD